MSTILNDQKIDELVKQALDLFNKGKLNEAGRLLREASSIDPNNASIKAVIYDIEQHEAGSKLPELCQKWLDSKTDLDLEYALDYLHKHPNSSDEYLTETMKIMMIYSGDSDVADEITGELLQHSGPKLILAKALVDTPTLAFDKIFDRGDDAMNHLIEVILDHKPWESDKLRIAAERDVLQLALAQLMRAGQDFPERAMKSISRLLAAETGNLKGLIDADAFDVILSNLDIRCSAFLKSQATLACAKLLEDSPATAKKMMSQYMVDRVIKPTGEGLIQVFSAAAALFPMEPKAASELFLSAGFLPNFPRLLKKWKSARLEIAALELLNVACMDAKCRTEIRRFCPEWLDGINGGAGQDQRRLSQTTMANLVLEKIRDNRPEGERIISIDDIEAQEQRFSRFRSVASDSTASIEAKQTAIEGLAFLSMQPWAKEVLANDKSTLKALLADFDDMNSLGASRFGIISVLANLTNYRPVISEEQKKIAELKAYANSSKPVPPDPLDSDEKVTSRCIRLLAIPDGITPLILRSHHYTSTVQSLIIKILLSLSHHPPNRAILAQQGTIKYLLTIFDVSSVPLPAKQAAANTLARILITSNPSHVFPPPITPLSAVRPLVTLLDPQDSDDDDNSTGRNLLPTFEALLALTNLASADEATCSAIVARAWPALEAGDLLVSRNVRVCRAATQLTCNLCASAAGAALFGHGGGTGAVTGTVTGMGNGESVGMRARARVQVLLALADSDDEDTRIAAAGAVAMASEWGGVVAVLLGGAGELVDKVLRMLEDETEAVVVRGVTALRNVAVAAKEVGPEQTEIVKSWVAGERGTKALENAVSNGQGDVASLVGEIVAALQ